MNILITNIWLSNHTGTEVGVRDLAIALHKRGIHIEVYSPELGAVADEIRNAGIHVVDSMQDLTLKPDLIHAQHFVPSMDAMTWFPGVPAVYFLRDRTHPADTPPKYSQIAKYMAVDYNCLDRLIIDNGIDEKKTGVLLNWVDTSRFKLRQKFSVKPSKALVFSNYATKNNYFRVIKEACSKMDMELDGLGTGLGNSVVDPENKLHNYDLVFAKGKAAMESLATGAGVIVCDSLGIGESVTLDNYDNYRRNSFWIKTLNGHINTDQVIQEIKKFNIEDTRQLSHKIRSDASFPVYMDNIIKLYHETITAYHKKELKNRNYDDEITIRKYLSLKDAAFKNELMKYEQILANPLKKQTNSFIEMKRIVPGQNMENLDLNREIIIIKNSWSYKIGRFLTAPARFFYDLFK